jgi:tetratricopeptide (TPR) repeat protein
MKLILFIVLFTQLNFAQESIFEKGNLAFQNGNYDLAIEYYKQIEANELESPELYFNMGNSYFKLDQIGMAILYFEKAKRLEPLSEDVLANLKLAKRKVLDDIELPDQLFIFDVYQSLKFSFTINQWLWAAALFFSLIFAFLWVKRWLFQQFQGVFSIAALIMSIGFIFSALIALVRIGDFETKQGVVIEAASEVYTSPNENNQAFILHEGTSFEIKRKVNGRYEISLIDGKTGWISVNDIGVI